MEKLTRTKIHEMAFICIFEYLFYQDFKELKKPVEEIIIDNMKSSFDNQDDYFKALVYEAIKNKDKYIPIIESKMVRWKFERKSLEDRAILLLATSEILNNREEVCVCIDNAIDLAHKYCDETSYKYINKVLDRISKENG